MRPDEMSLLLRGLSEEMVSSHQKLDTDATRVLLEALNLREASVNAEIFSTALRALAMTLMHRTTIGEEHFDEALKLLIRGLVLTGVEGEDGGD